ncbi:MAG TPA: ACP S-malonyltransferase [Acidimicrobiales bacterium]|nr:ACP S-malonyltransferase [Acidimicrobiales bacterium]
MRQGVGIAVLFPGQGTQVPSMGERWRAHPAWSIVEAAEAVLGEPVGRLLLDASREDLARTREAQLAVMLASLLAWEATRLQVQDPSGPLGGEPAVAFAGHSLGQVTALVAAGVLELEDGVRLVAQRADCTQRAADRHHGKMAALLGGTIDQAEEACTGVECWVANDNAPGQIVLGGTPEGLAAATGRATEIGVKRVMPLNVGGAFHTPLMADAREALMPILDGVQFQAGTAPVVSNLDACPHPGGDGWRLQLADHLVRPVRWRESMTALVDLGAHSFVEVGPGGVLAGLARRAVPGKQVHSVSVPDDITGLERAPKMEVA